MFDEIYTSQILERAARLPQERRLDAPDARAHRRSRLCGSEVDVELKMDGGKVADFGLKARACALGQCAASIVSENLIGASGAEIRHAREAMRAMLKDGGPPPAGRFADLAILQSVKDFPQRHASTLLMLDAAVACLDEIEGTTLPEATATS